MSKCPKCAAALRFVAIIVWLDELADDPIVSPEEHTILVKRERAREEYDQSIHSHDCPFRSEDEQA